MAIRVHGAGCCLVDLIYPQADFSSAAFVAAASRREGGLAPGRLSFTEDVELFTGMPFARTLDAIASEGPAARNVGGPSVVSLIHAAQMLEGGDFRVAFHGARGDDELGGDLAAMLARTGLDFSGLVTMPGPSPSTFVLSDPLWDGGRGERCFVNEIGAAADFGPEDLGAGFFDADLIAFGGTALVPRLHESLPELLEKARSGGAFTIVNTVFDFRAERRDGQAAWRLGGPASGDPTPAAGIPPGPGPLDSYRSCDLLVMDLDEALRLSGERELDSAASFFMSSGAGAFAITRGGDDAIAWAGGERFAPLGQRNFPVSARAGRERSGDTTGCGDAFAGGLIASLARQLRDGPRGLDLAEAVSWGIAAGAFTLGILGGTYYESSPGEKRALVTAYREDWLRQPTLR